MAAFTSIALGLGAGLGILGGIKSAQAQKEQADFESKQLEFNSRIASLQADDAIARGETEADQLQTQANLLKGTQKASAAAQGIDVGTGDAAALVSETDKFSQRDILRIKDAAAKEAFGFKSQSGNYYNQADMTRKAGEAASTATLLTTGANAISGGANIYAGSQKKSKDAELLKLLRGDK
jgi:hypothetical protein